jgi:acyl-CoA synthetase (AMP-forming)/AMP-acid ligase II
MFNVARRLTLMAQTRPDALAVVEAAHGGAGRPRRYRQVTFRQLDADSDRIARGLIAMGVAPGTRLALLVRPGIDFISLVFGLFKAGAVAILIDPGMGRRSLIGCLAEAEPEGFVAIPLAQAIRSLLRRRFPKARWNVTVGRRWFWRGPTLRQVRARGGGTGEGGWALGRGGDVDIDRNRLVSPSPPLPLAHSTDPAAIIFTTGSTGPPKGVLFTHGNFDAQVDQICDRYEIRPGEIDLPCFPLFGLFNCAMGVTAVIPDMDPSRPAWVDPAKIVAAAQDWNVTQAFGSPAVWDRVGRYCQSLGVTMPTIRRVLSAGAPIPAEVLRLMKACIHAESDVHTPYGATEALPVATISATEVLGINLPSPSGRGAGGEGSTNSLPILSGRGAGGEGGTAAETRRGAGVCVGRRFPGIQWKVIRVVDGPIPSREAIDELPTGQIGELIVRGPVVTRRYVTRVESNALAKIADGSEVWHRLGDCGYLDSQERFWFCGRVAHRVLTAAGPMYPVCCEAIFNQHPAVRRTALVGIGPPGRQRPVIVVELAAGAPKGPANRRAPDALLDELRRLGEANPLTAQITDFRFHPGFPVDIRHNAKIFREKLATWAAAQFEKRT